MSIKRKTIRQSTATMLLVWWFFNLLLAPSSAFAQELIEEPTPTPEIIVVTPESTPEPTPEPTSTVITGDAGSSAANTNEVNSNDTTLPGSIDTANCGVDTQTPCNQDLIVETENSVTVSAETASTSETGENAASTTVVTGDAGAVSLTENQVNTNEVVLEPTDTPPTASEVTPTPEISITNNNQAEVNTTAESGSDTGKNVTTGPENSLVLTGDAGAVTNVTNVVNTNVVGSDFQTVSITITDDQGENIDLNKLWQQILSVDENGEVTVSNWPTSPNVTLTVKNENTAVVNTEAVATANTGENSSESGSSNLTETGNATAVSNVTNIVNSNIIGSKFLLGNINILASGTYNLILPRPEWFRSMLLGGGNSNLTNQNLGLINSEVTAIANTGNNLSEGGDITTGDANALATNYSLINSNISMSDWFLLILNNLGNWNGQIENYSIPGSTTYAHAGSNYLYGNNQSDETTITNTNANVSNSNVATVNSKVLAVSNTGSNSGGNINTGGAKASANLVNLVNTNIIGSRFFLGLVNILGDWGGKVIFAYPDVTVSLSASKLTTEPGDEIEYKIGYENIGFDTAKGVKVNLDLPEGMKFISTSGKVLGGCEQTYCNWDIGNLPAKEAGEIILKVKINDEINFSEKQAFFEKLIEKVKAVDDRKEKEVLVKAVIATADPETSLTNNSFEVASVIYEKVAAPSESSNFDYRKPVIEVEAWNNVNDFVYPADTVTFAINVKNNSDVTAKNAKLVQKLYSPEGKYMGSMLFELGNIDAKKVGKISFGLNVWKGAASGKYRTESIVIAESPAGENVVSSISQTTFNVKLRSVSKINNLEYTKPELPKILGATTIKGNWTNNKKQDLWIWIMLLLTSTVILSNRLENLSKNNESL